MNPPTLSPNRPVLRYIDACREPSKAPAGLPAPPLFWPSVKSPPSKKVGSNAIPAKLAKLSPPIKMKVPTNIVVGGNLSNTIGPPGGASSSCFVPILAPDERKGRKNHVSYSSCLKSPRATTPSHHHHHLPRPAFTTPPASPFVKKHAVTPSLSHSSFTSRTSDMTDASSRAAFSPYMFSPTPTQTNRRSMTPTSFQSPSAQSFRSNGTKTTGSSAFSSPPARIHSSSFVSPTGRINSSSFVSPTGRKSRSSLSRKLFSPITPGTPLTPSTPETVVANAHQQEQQEHDIITRKQKLKTELCTHFLRSKSCPFGSSCVYAHGPDELQMTKLMDLSRAGLIDIDTYRTKPCMTWVATGSCPFGKRCSNIHDPRVIGTVPSWLPHTETQGNSMNTDINVDGLHQKRLGEVLYSNPFGESFNLSFDDWNDLYKMVCNTVNLKRRRNSLHEVHKLAIALQMRGAPGWMYKFRPQHVIYGNLCMVIQKKAFRLEKSGNAVSIAMSAYKPNRSDHVTVREIAFGPDQDPAARAISLWFNIPEQEVHLCSSQQAKRYRWKRPVKGSEIERKHRMKESNFDSRECFVMYRPLDQDAFNMTTKILQHRYNTVLAQRLPLLKERSQSLKALHKQREHLTAEFQHLRRQWISWAWPMNMGRQTVDDDTPVPSAESDYNPLVDFVSCSWEGESSENASNADHQDEAVLGSHIKDIWDSFVAYRSGRNVPSCWASPDPPSHDRSGLASKSAPGKRRLSVFKKLADGESFSTHGGSGTLGWQICQSAGSKSVNPLIRRQSERCWKSILVPYDKEGVLQTENDWDVVHGHFQNSRSKKVLVILQQ